MYVVTKMQTFNRWFLLIIFLTYRWLCLLHAKKILIIITFTRCPSFKRTLLNPYSSWPNEWNFTNFLPGQDKLDPFFMFNFQVCSFKIACFIRYLVKADRNEKSSKAKRSRTLTISWKLEACYSISSLLISSKLGTSIVYGMPHML